MRKYINIFLGLFLLSPIIYLFGLPFYQSLISVKSAVIKSLEIKLPTEIIVNNKEDIFSNIEEFITIRQKAIKKSLSKFEQYCEIINKEEEITDGSYYKYANILNAENNKKTSTYYILEEFKDNNPYGAYLKKEDEEYFDNKINTIEEDIERELKFLKRKYKNGLKIHNKEYSFKNVYKTFLYTYDAKIFLDDYIQQSDIDTGIKRFKELTLYKSTTSYGSVFAAIPELWNSVINKTEYNKPLMNYYLSAFDKMNNENFKSLKNKSRLIVINILNQEMILRRQGQIFIDLEYFGINDYIGSITLKKISNMIDTSLKNIKDSKKNKQIERTKTINPIFNDAGIVYSLDTYTVNIKSSNGRKYLKITIDLELNIWNTIKEIDNKAIVLKDRIIKLISSKQLDYISSNSGKNELIRDIIDESNKLLFSGKMRV